MAAIEVLLSPYLHDVHEDVYSSDYHLLDLSKLGNMGSYSPKIKPILVREEVRLVKALSVILRTTSLTDVLSYIHIKPIFGSESKIPSCHLSV
jgi:hypothetical protein